MSYAVGFLAWMFGRPRSRCAYVVCEEAADELYAAYVEKCQSCGMGPLGAAAFMKGAIARHLSGLGMDGRIDRGKEEA